jgi:lysophospholipase L1-like esterase
MPLNMAWAMGRTVCTLMKSLYGFSKPYVFYKILPVFGGSFLCLLTLIIVGVSAASGHLHWGTDRYEYFCYLLVLSLTGTILSMTPRIAWFVLAICYAELMTGVGTSALARIHIFPQSFLPDDDRSGLQVAPSRFQYHPLLQGAPTPNYSRSNPFPIEHDSEGIRGPQRVIDELERQVVIATLGGSTTYDIGVANGQTWSDRLEQQLGHGYAVINHGVPGYSTVENLLQTLFYLDTYGVKPRCAVYFVGWNDIRNAGLPKLDPAYANFHLLSQIDNLEVRRKLHTNMFEFSPLMEVVISSLLSRLQRTFDTIPQAEDFSEDPPVSGSDKRLEQIFRANLMAIAAINRERQITSIFVGQVLNRTRLLSSPNKRYVWLPLLRGVDEWRLQEHFNAILKETADAIGAPRFLPAIEQFQDDDFLDTGHFSAKGAAKFAGMLVPVVKSHCK